MSAILFRYRGELLATWAIGVFLWGWPPRGFAPSAVLLAAGMALRLWARRHIGPHSRGRSFDCPERSVGGPYRWIRHPLYAANLLVASSLALALTGPTPAAAGALTGPTLLYALLARAESRFVAGSGAPDRIAPHDRSSGGWRSEWASLLPPAATWIVLHLAAGK